MLAANQVDLRERIEHGARRLAHELERTADIERAIERLFRPVQAPEPNADLAERGERHAKAVGRPSALLELDAAVGERQRLLVAVLHQRDVRLIAADRRQHVARFDEQGEALGLRQRRHRFVEPALLSERDSRQRMHHCEVAPIADGMERRRRLRQVVADDRRVADLAIAEAQLEVGKADGAGIMRLLGRPKGFGEKRDAARGLTAGGRQPAVHAP